MKNRETHNRRIRWYDWVLALLTADFLSHYAALALVSETIWLQSMYGITSYVVWDLWNDYCKLRARR